MAQTKLTDLPEVLVADNAMEVLVDDAGTVKKITRANFVDGLASAGTTTAGGTSAGGGVGAGGAVELIALGDMTAGDAVVLNSDGTVSAVGESMQEFPTESIDIGSIASGTQMKIHNSVYDAVREQSIILYTVGNNNVQAKDRVGTTEIKYIVGHTVVNELSDDGFVVDMDSSLSVTDFLWGVRHEFYGYIAACVVGDKILIWYDTENGAKFQVGALTAGAVTWQAAQLFNNGHHATFYESSAFYDAVNDKVVLTYGAFDPALSGGIGGFSGYASSLGTPIDPYNISYYQNNGGRRTIGIYAFNGSTLSVVGALFQPVPAANINYPSFLNASAVHALSPTGTFALWNDYAGGGTTLTFDMDIYAVYIDKDIYWGVNTPSGREWHTTSTASNGGWQSTPWGLGLGVYKITTAWSTAECILLSIFAYKQFKDGTYPHEYYMTNRAKSYRVEQSSASSAPIIHDSHHDGVYLPGYHNDGDTSAKPNDIHIIYNPERSAFVYMKGSHSIGGVMSSLYIDNIMGVGVVRNLIVGAYSGTRNASIYAYSLSGHMVTHANQAFWAYTNGASIDVSLYRPGEERMSSSLADGYFLGFAADNFLSGDSALILTVGSIENTHTGLVPGTPMWIAPDGALQTGEGELSIFAGTALTTNKLLVRF
jgi:hypothetical protein